MAFYRKFTRSGRISERYVSLIIDVTPDSIDQVSHIWRTSFEEIGMCLILLHDVEVYNVPSRGPTKTAFRNVVQKLGYDPSLEYKELRHKMSLVKGQSVMGRHGGTFLDWGYYSCMTTPIDVNTSSLQVANFIDASDGKLWKDMEDKLSCFRNDSHFILNGKYYDLMPKHEVMVPLAQYLLATDKVRANNFFSNILRWSKISHG